MYTTCAFICTISAPAGREQRAMALINGICSFTKADGVFAVEIQMLVSSIQCNASRLSAVWLKIRKDLI